MQSVKTFQLRQIPGCFLRIIMGILGLLLLANCTPTTSPPSISDVTATVANDPGHPFATVTIEDFTRTATATSTRQPTKTPVPPTLTPSPTNTLTPEPTPTLTLTNEQKADNLRRLMTENGGCELPCWWGIVPGETNFAMIPELFVPQGLVGVKELSQLFVILKQERMVWLEGGIELHARGAGSSIGVQFEVENDIIQSIKVRGGKANEEFVDDWGHYSLDQVLTRYGVPSQVFVYNGRQAHPGPAYYRLLLFYETIGVAIDYAGIAQHPIDGKSQVCPDLSQVSLINLFLYQPGKVDNVVELVLPPQEVDFVISSGTVYDLIKWEQSVGTSLEAFHETFKDGDSNNCFEFTVHRYR